VNGIAWQPRLIAKARIKLRGESNPDLHVWLRRHPSVSSWAQQDAATVSATRVGPRRRWPGHRWRREEGCWHLKSSIGPGLLAHPSLGGASDHGADDRAYRPVAVRGQRYAGPKL